MLALIIRRREWICQIDALLTTDQPNAMSLTSKQYHHGDLKAAILERAAQIIATEGLEALSLRAIARDLGV